MDKALAGLAGIADPKPVPRRTSPRTTVPKVEPQAPPGEQPDPMEADPGEETPAAESTEETTPPEEAAEQEQVQAKNGEKPEKGADPKKPWDLVKSYKGENSKLKLRVAEMEKQLNDLKTNRPEDLTPKYEAAQKRLSELENEIQFVNYAKSNEFTTKYQQPYEDAFIKAASDLRGLNVSFEQNGEVQTRPIDVDDIAALASLPPEKARALIKSQFPEDHEEVKSHIKEIRRLAESRAKALEDAKKNGTERASQYDKHMRGIQEHAQQVWQKTAQENAQKFEFLKIKEGDDEHNTKLTEAAKFVDEALAQNPYDPRHTPEQRADIIARQASIRDRSVAYSPLKLANKRLAAENAELKKALAEFQSSEPGAGGTKRKANDSPSPDGGGMNMALDRLAQLAR